MKELLIDVGNSRIKWGLSEAPAENCRAYGRSGGILPEAVKEAWRALKPVRAWISSVAGAEFDHELAAWLTAEGIEAHFAVVAPGLAGLSTDYLAPETLGVDRWLAMAAAYRQVGGAVCVVDCGTALTLDYVAADGRHEGGLILPGLRLMQESLLERAPGIRAGAVVDVAETGEKGCDTVSCIRLGAQYGAAGAVREALRAWRLDNCVIAGGDGHLLASVLGREEDYRADLVLSGVDIFRREHGV